MLIREAEWRDLNELVALEKKVFAHDRIGAEEFLKYVAGRIDCHIFVMREAGFLTGYGIMIYPFKSKAGYLYSICSESKKGHLILKDLETAAWNRKRSYIRLEVKAINQKAIEFYVSNGYRRNKRYRNGLIYGFYEDGSAALSMIKKLEFKPFPATTLAGTLK